ncbi:MAG: thiol peroxidase [Treponemataceae bacterium]
MKITMGGNEVKLSGEPLKVGAKVPDFLVKDEALHDVTLADTKGLRLFVAVPSLDTPVCDTEVRRFYKETEHLNNVSVSVFSVDTPFAQKRWCAGAGIKNLSVYSDFYNHSFGKAFGILLSDLGLLARAIFIIDEHNTVIYSQVVSEVTNEPDYDAALTALKKA